MTDTLLLAALLTLQSRRVPASVPGDGRSDTAAIQAAVDAGPGVVYLPGGPWELDGPVYLRGTGVALEGDGGGSVTSGLDYYSGPHVVVGHPTRTLPLGCRPAAPPGVWDYSGGQDGYGNPRTPAATNGAVLAAVGSPLQFGFGSKDTGADYWGGAAPLTIDLFVGRLAGTRWGAGSALCGIGDDEGHPAPIRVQWDTWGFTVSLATVGGGWTDCRIPAPEGQAAYRLTIQVQPGARWAAWVDRRKVASGAFPGSLEMSDGFSPWQFGAVGSAPNWSRAQITPLVVYGFRALRQAPYDWDAAEQRFAVGPWPVIDSLQFFEAHALNGTDRLIACLPLTDRSPGPDLRVDTPHGRTRAFWVPATDGAPYEASTGLDVRGLTMRVGCQAGVELHSGYNVRLERLTITGGAQAVGGMHLANLYPVSCVDCRLAGWDAAFVSDQTIGGSDRLWVETFGREALRIRGGFGEHRELGLARQSPYSLAAVRAVGTPDGQTLRFSSMMLDNESAGTPPVIFDLTQGAYATGSVVIDQCSAASVPAAFLRLTGRPGSPPYEVEARHLQTVGMAATAAVVSAHGAGWSGTVDASQLGSTLAVGDVGSITVIPPGGRPADRR